MTDADIQSTLDNLAGDDPYTKTRARKTIRNSGDRRYGSGLLDLLTTTTDHHLQRECITLIGRIEYNDAVPTLMRLLTSTVLDENLQEDVIIALGRIGDDRAEQSILALADSTNVYIRQRVAKALGSFQSEAGAGNLP